ncbi:hypothetical protein [Muriicola sp. Z0-33]|uniref:hypothetical protein n=1 Tax=Muriicola sp. Z0-33 TaxID=2816957 RepID=UPI00223820C0|nr:hypothetical protein [Muriicola sp. Z0-33]MCW5514730.1 hypothetical protein [Muriicola sp. Z0-33]
MERQFNISIFILFLVCTASGFSQSGDIYTATKIDKVETYFYSPYRSQLKQTKARLEVQGSDPIAEKKYTFSLNFYEDLSTAGRNNIRDAGNRIIIMLHYPIKDFNYYDRMLNEVDRSQLNVTYEVNEAAWVDHFRIKRTK